MPWVENGTVTLIGATTENPFFEVNKALVSRSRLFRLQSLDQTALHQVLDRALSDRTMATANAPSSCRLTPDSISLRWLVVMPAVC